MKTKTDIQYASVDSRDLLLDLYLPDDIETANLIVWIHGGAWSFGTKEDVPILDIVNEGFALASIDFRNSPEAQFPAQIHDIKAAIRFLRANAAEYGYSSDNISIWGYSSGGHLAALTGTTNGNAVLEGNLGDFQNTSSDIQAIIDFSGPTNLQSILHQSTPHGMNVRVPALQQLLGKSIEDPSIQDSLNFASPVNHVNTSSPPLLIMHGLQDNQVPINQSLELQNAYLQQGLNVEVQWLPNAQHASTDYFEMPFIGQVANFLRKIV